MPDTTPMRVLFLSDHLGYPGGVIHGATTYFQQVLPRLAKDPGVTLTCCFLRGYHDAVKDLSGAGVEPIFLDRSKWDPRALFDLVQLIHRHRIQLVHAAGMKGMILARIAARWTGARCLVHFHDVQQPSAGVVAVQRCLARWTDAAVGVSRDTCDVAIDRFNLDARHVHRLHNAKDLSPYKNVPASARSEMRKALSLPSTAPVLAMVGRFSPVKDHPAAIEAMQTVRAALPEARLVLIGDGPERKRCEAMARAKGLTESVHFLGQRRDVPHLLAAADGLVMPSGPEGLPFAVIEALACGVPVVAYRHGGLPEMIEHDQSGLLVPPNNRAALAEALTHLLSNEPLRQRLSEGAKKRAAMFDIEYHIARLLALYQQVIGKATQRRPMPSPQASSEVRATKGTRASTLVILTAGALC
jgi:glycosyltransferase involved in cell wall biosynthesis